METGESRPPEPVAAAAGGVAVATKVCTIDDRIASLLTVSSSAVIGKSLSLFLLPSAQTHGNNNNNNYYRYDYYSPAVPRRQLCGREIKYRNKGKTS